VTCKIEGCEKPVKARGWCEMHHGRWRRHGDPLTLKTRPQGSGSISPAGYVRYRSVLSNPEGKREHIVVAERALGKPLPAGAVVHHFNENPSDNRPENLVVCPSEHYHNLLHKRMRALAACGNADYLKCKICKEYDARENLFVEAGDRHHWHRSCRNAQIKKRRDSSVVISQ
jgi:hypothetical protein